jgi:hypothetical protein
MPKNNGQAIVRAIKKIEETFMNKSTSTFLTVVISLISLNSYAMGQGDVESGSKLTAVQYKTMQTEDNGPSTNDWVDEVAKSSRSISMYRTGLKGLTAVQYKRLVIDNDGPDSNDWVVFGAEPSSNHSQKNGYTAVQYKNMQTEDNGPSSNDWASAING